MSFLLPRLLLIIYLLSTAGFIVFIIRRNKQAAKGGLWFLRMGFILQAGYLVFQAIHLNQIPALTVADGLAFYSWALVGVYLLLSYRFDIPVLGTFVAPVVSAALLLSLVLPTEEVGQAVILKGPWVSMHLAAIFLGYAFFTISFLAAIMYLLQERQIKTKKTQGLFKRLPSLNALDTLNFFCISIGFPLITLGLITGFSYARLTLGSFFSWDPKEIWSIITWLIYAALLHQRVTVGWRGRRAAIMSILGFVLICFTFLGVTYIRPSYHTTDQFRSGIIEQGPSK